jgi:hypothetical protein
LKLVALSSGAWMFGFGAYCSVANLGTCESW